MNKVKVITDSCSDLSEKLLEKYRIDYAKMRLMRSGISSPALLNWSASDAHSFYDAMRGGEHITTAQVTYEEYYEIFELYLSLGFDIVYIGCSSKQFASVFTARFVAKRLLENHPHSAIVCIDSHNFSVGEGILAIEASRLASEGYGVFEIEASILSMRKNVAQFLTVGSLQSLYRVGRVKGSTAFFCNMTGIKPIITSEPDGSQSVCKNVIGRTRSLKELALLIKNSVTDQKKQTLYVVHSDCSAQELDTFLSIIRAHTEFTDVEVCCIGPVIGALIGPDAIGVFAFCNGAGSAV